jgi:hypothetical protein
MRSTGLMTLRISANTYVTGNIVALTCAVTALAAMAAPSPLRGGRGEGAEAETFFETKVRPVLAENCYGCHSEKVQMAGLRLDTSEGIRKGSDRGPVLIPGDPQKSALIQAIHYDGKIKMPPKGKLPSAAIEALTTWIQMGAPWPQTAPGAQRSAPSAAHWAFRPVKQPPVPKVKNTAWPASEIDRFILAKLEAKGMAPAKPADRRTLIRRATFDLIGLPPTAEEVAAFVADRSPNAFAKVVDRLLASPRYGERWGRYWLDVARYADSKGYVFQEERRYPYAYTYRDWVVRALNEDLPYDRFLIQQIAADHVVTGDDKRSLAAMGFLTLGRRFLNNTPDIIDDRIDVVMRGTMALTVACARCHDHKFDPIPTQDYYSLYGVFASSREPEDLPLISAPTRNAAYLAYEKELREREKAVDDFVRPQHAELVAALRARVGDYLLLEHDARSLTDRRQLQELARSRELSPFVLRRWREYLDDTRNEHHPVFAPWHAFAALPAAEFAARAKELAAKVAEGADPKTRVNPLVAQLFAGDGGRPIDPPTSLAQVAQRYGELFSRIDKAWQEALATHAKKVAQGEASEEPKSLPDPDEEQLRLVLYGEGAPPNVPLESAQMLGDRAFRNKVQELRRKVEELKATSPAAPPRAMVLVDAPRPMNPRVFRRGNPNNPGEEVPRQFLQVLSGEKRRPFQKGSGRLELARAIASPENPLTARVMVNRVWMHHFGYGLVRTPGDFGTRGEPPTHPELLDWLASRFVADGWSLKKLHRRIMLSRVYQQSSDDNPKFARLDPENRLLWKMNRRRLDFEATRDSLLAVAGELDTTLGGPAVEITTAPYSRRRTIYGFIDRQNLPGLFRNFDFASPDSTSPQRYQTTVPQQALFLLNSPFVAEQARRLAARANHGTQVADRIQRLYRLAYGRSATPEEVQLGEQFLKSALPAPPRSRPEPSVWRYGYGEYDAATGRVKSFRPLRWNGEAYQGGEAFPDRMFGRLRLTATGGHTGNDRQHAAIRRWVAPRDGVVAISGTLNHPSDEGDGIEARIVSSRAGQLAHWTLQEREVETKVDRVEVRAGDTIDFVVECRANPESDSFRWAPVVRMVEERPIATKEWNANTGFDGPPVASPQPLTAWEKYAQVLLMANEFVFVD